MKFESNYVHTLMRALKGIPISSGLESNHQMTTRRGSRIRTDPMAETVHKKTERDQGQPRLGVVDLAP